MSPPSWSCWWFGSCLLALSVWTWALELDELFEFGEEAGDQQLPLDSDSTAELLLNQSVMFFQESFDKVYINTNGFVAFSKPTAEEKYLGNMPSDFKMIAALLGNLENGDGQGQIYFRQDSRPSLLSRAAEHIRQAFPGEEEMEPIHAVIVTWENMAAQGTFERGDGVGTMRNTFQLVVASTKSFSWAILLYPNDGLQFLSTSIREEIKLVEAGFNEGVVVGWFWSTKQGTYFRTTTDEEASIRELTTKTNSGKSGVWVYKIGASSAFTTIIPGVVTSSPEDATDPPVTMLPRQTDEPHEVDFPTDESQMTKATEVVPEVMEKYHTQISENYRPSHPETETVKPGYSQVQTEKPDYVAPGQFEQEYPQLETVTPTYTSPERVQQPMSQYPDESESRYPDQTETRYPALQTLQPVQPVPPHSRHQQPNVVVVSEDEDLDVDVFSYNLETCTNSRHKCSAFGDCRDYRDGYCCHCRPGFYGNGKDCVAEGKPQRMNGKVKGRVFMGNSTSPVELDNYDLHSYVVPNDGRAYIAISNVPNSVGPSLQLLSSLGGIIGWAFALQQPGYQNGFSLIGGVFSRQAEVIFQPHNERLIIKQKFKGIDEHSHLIMSTELEGRLPAIPLGYSIQINPYKEIYQYDRNLVTSSSNRAYNVVSPDGDVQTRSYQWRQTITFQSCPHDENSRVTPSTQQLSVDQIFVMFDTQNNLIRYAMSNKIGSVHSDFPEQNPCFTGRHGCDINAVCRPGDGLQFSCECTVGFSGDGRYCFDTDECRETPQVCGPNSVCSNQPGSFRCDCISGFIFASDGKTCIEESRPVDHCQRGSHDCDVPERAMCRYTGGSSFVCMCLPGYDGDGRVCSDADECRQDRCHREAVCSNTQGSYSCQCRPGFQGDGFQCSPVSSEREMTPCELHKERAQASITSSGSGFFSFLRPQPAVNQYIPQCDEHGAYEPTQCHNSIGQCWCVDANGQEIPNTRTGRGSTPLCINQVVLPTPLGPTPRPDIHPVPPGTHLLFAQSGKIEHVPLDGYSMKKEEAKPLLHIPDRVVIAVAYDCVERMVYWTDITGPAISKASLAGGDIIPVITKELQSPEGIAIDHVARLIFWTDSMRDTIEVAKLDGSQRRVLFDTDLVNPRPIVTNPAYGRLYWADWNRDGPKIEMSNMDGTERSVLVKDDLGLPNGLTFDPDNQQLCWADAGIRRVECMDLHRQLRRQIVEGIQYPFSLVSFGKNLYYTDWRREAVVGVDRHSEKETEEFLPQKRSRLYGITTTPTQCAQVYNYCSNNAGCSHLCLPRLGGFSCRCPDASDGQCVERSL